MSEPWIILTSRYGGNTRNPTPAKLAEAIAKLYHETLPGMTDADYSEHGTAILRYGYDDGPMVVLEFNRLREARLEECASKDSLRRGQCTMFQRTKALQLWSWLPDQHHSHSKQAYTLFGECGLRRCPIYTT